jgi:light-regulated signal transduction histidine kinase (bacteriophytochrome)
LNELEPALASYIVRGDLAIEDRRSHAFDAGREAVEVRHGGYAFDDLASRIDELVAEEEHIVIQAELRAVADRALVRSLIDILVGNSYKFTRNTPVARIEAGELQLDGERVLFIRDNGAGFDMAHYDKLFSPFGRLHTVAEFPGTGIGLATARRVVQRHLGRIWADGHVGLGATFYFTLAASPK